jgi:hypothetical protein
MMKFSPYLYSTSIIMPTFEDKIPKPATARRQQSNALFGPSLLQTKKDITDMGSTHTSAAEPLPDMDFSKRVYKPYKPGNTPTAESWREEIDRLAGVKPIGRESKSQHIQAKLAVGKPNDKYEQEADTIADKIMTTSGSSHPNAPVHNVSTTVQGSAIDTGITATPETEQKLDNTAGGGAPLHKGIKAFMEPHFGTDFSRVKVHTGSDAAQMNRELGSHAFTHGSNIYFNEGQYQPETNSGKKLLAHELTHVVQQGAVQNSKSVQLQRQERKDQNKVSDKNTTANTNIEKILTTLISTGQDKALTIIDKIFGTHYSAKDMVLDEGYFYSYGGEFLGHYGKSEEVYIAEGINHDAVLNKINAQKAMKLGISNTDMTYAAGVISKEGDSKSEMAFFAHVAKNAAKKKGQKYCASACFWFFDGAKER